MQQNNLAPNIVRFLFIALFLVCSFNGKSQCIPLANAFAHNDYWHKHPLFDAVKNGYTNIEADVFLYNNKLIVAHINPYFKGKRTLETLYLQPLLEQINKNNGHLYNDYDHPVTLMIDIKSDAKKTYNKLKPLLEKYRPILSSYDNGKVSPNAITIVLSGHKPYTVIKNEQNRLAFIDEDLRKAPKDTSANTGNIYTMASCKYSKLLKWKGSGDIPVGEQRRLCRYVSMAHKNGEKVRLWASPENKIVWKEMLSCGVDLINTDKLADLKNFLISKKTNYTAAN